MRDLTTKKYWTNLKRKSPKKSKEISVNRFKEILNEHLSKNNGIALEIGCVPGTFLAYICKEFGYYPEGIDFDEKAIELTSKTLEDVGITKFKIHKEDFNKWEAKKKYDLVCSFGFVEHFDDATEIIKKHIDLMKRKGKLIIEIPNFSGFNGFLHRLVDKPNLLQHNTSIMNMDFFERLAKKNKLKVLYLGYYGSFHFQWGYGRRETANLFQKVIYAFLKIISKITINIKMRNKLSNYIVFIAENE